MPRARAQWLAMVAPRCQQQASECNNHPPWELSPTLPVHNECAVKTSRMNMAKRRLSTIFRVFLNVKLVPSSPPFPRQDIQHLMKRKQNEENEGKGMKGRHSGEQLLRPKEYCKPQSTPKGG